jgi:hypothetical protein
MRSIDSLKSVSLVAALLTLPSLHANTFRIEALIYLLFAGASGSDPLDQKALDHLLNKELKDTWCASQEDPIEDVFVSNVITSEGNRLLFEGIWESNDFYLQIIYNTILTLPKHADSFSLLQQVHALLRLSDAIARRRGLLRYRLGGGAPGGRIELPPESVMTDLARSVQFTDRDLEDLGVGKDEITHFELAPEKLCEHSLLEESDLYACPIVRCGTECVVALPSAIGIAVRHRVFEWVSDHGYEESFDHHLFAEYRAVLADTRLFGSSLPIQAFLPKKADDGTISSELMVEIDHGRFCHLMIAIKGLRAIETNHSDKAPSLFENRIVAARAAALKSPHFRHGLTIIVYCGVGLPILEMVPHDREDWWVQAISGPDFVTLLWLDGGYDMLVWKLLQHLDRLQNEGLQINNPNGLLNLFAWWQSQGHWILPSRSDIERMPSMLTIPTDSCARIRADFRFSRDIHLVRHPDGRNRLVQRKLTKTYFASDTQQPLYASMTDVAEGVLLALWEGRRAKWWIKTEQGRSTLDRDTVYRLWDTASNWLQRIVPELESAIEIPEDHNFEFVIDLDQCSSSNEWAPTAHSEDESISFSVELERRVVRLSMTNQFLALFHVPENIAERAMVRAMVMGAVTAISRHGDPEEIERHVEGIVPNKDARNFHVFTANSFREMIRARDSPKALLVDEAETTLSKLGLGWTVNPNRNATTISTPDASVSMLSKLVHTVFLRMKEALSTMDRKYTILSSLRAIEGIEASREQWQSTSRAVLALRTDSPEAAQTIIDHLGHCNASAIALRIIIEIALQETPAQGGRALGKLDLIELMADALMLFHLGGMSDAIRKQVMPPEIMIAANGDILFHPEFNDNVLSTFGKDFGLLQVRRHSSRYERHYQYSEPVPTMIGHLDLRFLNAFAAEFGFTVDQLRGFKQAVEDHAMASRRTVFHATKQELLAICRRCDSCDETVVPTVLDAFSLVYRGGFESTPEGFEKSDWYPWRFRRRLSLIAKPLVKLDEVETSTYLVSPGLLGEGIMVTLTRYYESEVDATSARSQLMKQWLADESARRAHQLVLDVAGSLEAFGYMTLIEKSLSELIREKVDSKFGDVDVFAWKPHTGIAFAIECKDLRLAKTTTEIAEQLSRFSGQTNIRGKKDELLKHLERCHELQKRSAALCGAATKLVAPLTVNCVVCFSRPAAVRYVQSRFPSIRFVTLDDLRSDPKSLGQ